MIHKKFLSFLLVLMLFFTGCSGNDSDNNETTSATSPADCFSNDQYTAVDSGSYTASQLICYQNGNLYEYTNNFYDDNGNLTYTCTYDNTDTCVYWAESEYDDNNCEMTKKVAESGGTYDYYYENEYDDEDRITRQLEYDNQEQIVSSIKWEYNGLKTTETCYSSDGQETQVTETTVDDKGSILSLIITVNGEIQSDTEYEYDQYGNTTSYSCDGQKYTYDNQYDDNGNLVNKLTYINGEKSNTDKFTYNSDNKCIAYEYVDESTTANTLSFTYDYDAAGNRTLNKNNTTGETTVSTYNSDKAVIDYQVIGTDGSATYEEKTDFFK